MSDLDKDFKRVEKQVRAKMEAAAALIKEAKDMADANGIAGETNEDSGESGLASWDFYDAVRPLRDAMDYAGWRTSSWGC
jgi:hypothetical protein